jgi:cell division protease FtsH
MNTEFLERISTRKQKLEDVKIALKDKFIGIDDVIDKIVDNISLWYLTPEIQFIPLIVSLWGITGVGKTDLVRTLVRLLDYTNKFIEIQMDVKNDYCKNIENYLENSGVDCNEPTILLLDEIQRYRTLDEEGRLLDNKYFNDIWMLLSDGKFQNNSQRREDVMELMLDELYYLDRRNEDNEEKDEAASDAPKNAKAKKGEKPLEKKPRIFRYKTSHWTASRFKRILNLKLSVEEIMVLSLEDRMKIMEDSLKMNNLNEGKSYEKLLIFISGNLDEAFQMADEVEDSERDADIYHELSKRINIIHIKGALAKKFKPEQIARFGNNHIIYPCLDKQSYYKIIRINCKFMLDRIEKQHNIKITLADSIYDIIYRNGVFPAQGVRPAISTVFNVLGSNLPFFMYYALINDVNEFHIDYSEKQLFTLIAGNEYRKDVILEIDNIRNNKSIDEKILVIVHELGHALVYGLVFGTPPRQIITNSSGFANGFVINHSSIDNKTFIKNQIAIYLSGLVAEEIVFGEDFKSNGASTDISFATNYAGHFVRSYGMDGTIAKITRITSTYPYEADWDVNKTNTTIENLLEEQKKRARDLISQNIGVYKELVQFAVGNGGITIEQFLTICNKHGLNFVQKDINEKLIYSYDNKLQNFLNQKALS